jgi:hypothetical protein
MEVRPLSTAKVKPRNLAGLLEVLHSSGRPFRFFLVNCESGVVEGRRVVRFFLELPDEYLGEHVANLLRASMDVEVVEAEPPKAVYERCLDLELARHYALPTCAFGESVDLNPVDGIVGALSSGVGAFEVAARGDPKAKLGIYQYIHERTHRKAGVTKAFTDVAVGILAEASVQRDVKGISREAWWRYGRQWKQDSWRKAEVEAAGKKLQQNLFTCEVKAYGTSEGVETILSTLPSAMNRLRRFKAVRRVEAPMRLARPGRHGLRNALSHLWKILPPATLVAAYYSGLFNPLRLAWVDVVTLALAVAFVFPLLAVFRRRNPVVLSVDELALMVGLPTAVGRLPVELGAMPLSRKPLAKGLNAEL